MIRTDGTLDLVVEIERHRLTLYDHVFPPSLLVENGDAIVLRGIGLEEQTGGMGHPPDRFGAGAGTYHCFDRVDVGPHRGRCLDRVGLLALRVGPRPTRAGA